MRLLTSSPTIKWGVAAFGRKPPFEFPSQFAALCRDAATSGGCPVPKRQRAGALHDASRHSGAIGIRASVLDCGGPPPLFPRRHRRIRVHPCPSVVKSSNTNCPGHPSQNEFRNRVPVRLRCATARQVRLHPISVFAKHRRDESARPVAHAEFGMWLKRRACRRRAEAALWHAAKADSSNESAHSADATCSQRRQARHLCRTPNPNKI